VPYKWRINPGAYLYFRTLTKKEIEDEESGVSSEQMCVICLNAIRFDVDAHGTLLSERSLISDPVNQTRSWRDWFRRPRSDS
jgi:hypothetical protein